MAISQMKKLSFILRKDKLNALLKKLQDLQLVEIRDIKQLETWKEALFEKQDNLAQISHFDNQEELQLLMTRQADLEKAIKNLSLYLPKVGKLASLKKETPSVTYDQLVDLEDSGHIDRLLFAVNHKLDRLAEISKAIEELDISNKTLEKWQNLQIVPNQLHDFNYLNGQIGTVPSTADDKLYRQLKANPDIQIEEIFHDETEYGLVLFWNKELDMTLEDYQFILFDYDGEDLPSVVLSKNKKQLEILKKDQSILLNELQSSKEDVLTLQMATDLVLDTYSLQAVKQGMARTEHLVAIEGWTEERNINRLIETLKSSFGTDVIIEDNDVTEEDWESVPIKLRNHPLIEPFELITEMYALPKYNEKDPTPLLAPFYFAFFGMMVADLGYGLLLFLVTWWASRNFNVKANQKRFLKFFNILGVAVSLWGIVYGSFFGFTMPLVILSTQSDVMTILILSVVFGFITVIVGLLLGGLQQVRMKDYGEAYQSGFAWCFILIGLLLIAIGLSLPNFAVLVLIGKWLAIINAIGIVLVAIVKSKSLSGLGSGLYNLYNISSYIGDLVSFTRLMALGLSGASIGSAFNLIVGIFPPIGRFTVGIALFILLHAINIFLSLLSGYVHGARLMFVEFFGKFYQGGGKAFAPLKSTEKYIKIKRKTQLEE
ncbi:V-type ATP synthase subunit I [Streptococcus hongkongensis]|nr:ATP synthase subunit I [Streptococcus uberis]